jgi:hypothetical protein
MFERYKAGRTEINTEDHLSTMKSILNIGFLCCIMGQSEEAKDMLRSAWDWKKKRSDTESAALGRDWKWNEQFIQGEASAWDIYLDAKTNLGIHLY